jgi:hypothetical protein
MPAAVSARIAAPIAAMIGQRSIRRVTKLLP